MKNYDKNTESSYLQYNDANNLYGWTMSEKLPIKKFEWVDDLSKINEDFIKNYDENSDVGYFLEVDIEYPKKLFDLHKDLPFLLERKKIGEVEKLVCAIEDKKKYIIYISALKQALNHGLRLTNVHRVIRFNQQAWLKPYIYMNTKLRKEAKNDFVKEFFKLMNNSVFGKTMENVRKHRDIKLVTTAKRRIKLVSEPSYHAIKHFSENLIAIEMKKVRVVMNKPVYFGLATLDISKILIYKFWYDYIMLQYGDKARLCYMDTDSLVIYIKTEDFYKDVADDVEELFDTSNYDEKDERPLPTGKNKKVIGLFKDELGGKIMKEFVALRAKTYAYLMNDDSEHKKAKGKKKCVIKHELMFENYKDSLFNNAIAIKI